MDGAVEQPKQPEKRGRSEAERKKDLLGVKRQLLVELEGEYTDLVNEPGQDEERIRVLDRELPQLRNEIEGLEKELGQPGSIPVAPETKKEASPQGKETEANSETKTFLTLPADFIKGRIEKLLQSVDTVKEIKSVSVEGTGDEIKIVLAVTGQKAFVTVDINASVLLENSGSTVRVKEHKINSSSFQDMVEGAIAPQISKIPELLKTYIEKEEGKKVETIQIENGGLRVTLGKTIVQTKKETKKVSGKISRLGKLFGRKTPAEKERQAQEKLGTEMVKEREEQKKREELESRKEDLEILAQVKALALEVKNLIFSDTVVNEEKVKKINGTFNDMFSLVDKIKDTSISNYGYNLLHTLNGVSWNNIEDEKKATDPLFKFRKEILKETSLYSPFSYATADVATIDFSELDLEKRLTTIRQIRFNNYHDFLLYKKSLTREQADYISGLTWDKGAWQGTTIFSDKDFWAKLDDPNDPSYKFRDEFHALKEKVLSGEVEDTFPKALETIKHDLEAKEAELEKLEKDLVLKSVGGVDADIGEVSIDQATPEEKEEVKKVTENLSDGEKMDVMKGLLSVGFKVEKLKNTFWGKTFGLFKKATKGRDFYVARFMNELSESFKRDAKTSGERIKDIQKGTGSWMTNAMGPTLLIGNVWKYGLMIARATGKAAVTPYFLASTLGMAVTKGAEAAKEAHLRTNEAAEKTRIKNAEKAAEEAWMLYEEVGGVIGKAEGTGEFYESHGEQREKMIMVGGEGKDASAERLNNAYLKKLPADLLRRLETEPGVASGFIQRQIKKDVKEAVERLNKNLQKIENNTKLSVAEKELKKRQLLNGMQWKNALRDYDRLITEVGTVDEFAMGSIYVKAIGRGAIFGSMLAAVDIAINNKFENLLEASKVASGTFVAETPEIPTEPDTATATDTTKVETPVDSAKTPTDSVVKAATTPDTTQSASQAHVTQPAAGAETVVTQFEEKVGDKVDPDAIVRKWEGITHALSRQIKHAPALAQELGYTGDPNDAIALDKFADKKAWDIAVENGYVNEGTGQEIRVRPADRIAYEINMEDHDGDVKVLVRELKVKDGVIEEIVERHGKEPEFEGGKHEKYEYVEPEKNVPTGAPTPQAESPTPAVTPRSEGGEFLKSQAEIDQYKKHVFPDKFKTEEVPKTQFLETLKEPVVTPEAPKAPEEIKRAIVEQMDTARPSTGMAVEQAISQASAPVHGSGGEGNYNYAWDSRVPGAWGGFKDYFGWGVNYDDTARILDMEAMGGIELPPEFAENNFDLLPAEMKEVYDVYRENLSRLGVDKNVMDWVEIKDMDAGDVIKDAKFGPGSGKNNFQSYLQLLEKVTREKPIGGLFRKEESVGEYISRALQKAGSDNKLHLVKLK